MKTKRFLALLLATVMLLSAIAFNAFAEDVTPDPQEVLAGDADGDGKISTKDLLLLRRYLANYSYESGTSTYEVSAGADMNGDGDINTLDVVALRGWLTENDFLDESYNIPDVMVGETIDAEYAADFSVAEIFSDDMVVQRHEHIRVWGFAPESENGKKVSGEFKGMFAEALIENGEWCLTFTSRLSADTKGAQMKIYTDKKTVTFNDVLVGDVYLVMGQSNAAYTLSDHFGHNDPATQGGGASDIDPNSIIRINRLYTSADNSNPELGTDTVLSDLYSDTSWTKTTSGAALSFSAIGYYFAKNLTDQNPNVPVGLMQIAKGGAPLVSFLPNDLADKYQSDYLDVEDGKYYSNITREHMGRYFYNCFLAPIEKYALAGVVWYQGESNNSLTEASVYNEAFADLMTRLRSTHNVINKDFPVFITELPSIYSKPADYSGSSTWYYMELGIIRSYIGSIPTILKNSYVAASGDLWNDKTFSNNLHPNCKYEQAERLAAIAGAVIYRRGDLEKATGPVFESATISADKKSVVLTFDNVGAGLATEDGGNAVLGLVGFKADKVGQVKVTPVSATITAKNQITVVFDTEVKGVAYNYDSADFYGDTINLCNSFGCPATAFMTPYEEIDLGQFKSEDFILSENSILIKCTASMDSLKVSGNDYFEIGKVNAGLQSSGYKIQPVAGASNVNLAGWVGFGYETIMFGYSIDGGDAIFNTYPTAPGQAVIEAGGEYAQRFSITVPLRDLSVGEHTLDFLALVDVEGGVAVKLLSLTVEISKIYKAEDFVSSSDSSVNFKGYSVDAIRIDANHAFEVGKVNTGLILSGNRIAISEGGKSLVSYGWIGFTGHEILKFGYSIDGSNAVFKYDPKSPSDAVIKAGGAQAKAFEFTSIDISGLGEGEHTIRFLALLDINGGTAVNFLEFTLIITPKVTNAELVPTTDTSINFKKLSIDSLTAEGGTRNELNITIAKGTSTVTAAGWVGFTGNKIVMFGYAIDGKDVIFNSYPLSAEQGVVNAAGELAKRYSITINSADLSAGDHPVYLVALIDVGGTRVAVKILKITITVTE